jgi:hypothetical protein
VVRSLRALSKKRREAARSVAAFAAGGEFSPDEVNGEGEDGEDEQKVDFSVRDVAEEDCEEPEDGQHGGEQEEEHWFVVLGFVAPGLSSGPEEKQMRRGVIRMREVGRWW